MKGEALECLITASFPSDPPQTVTGGRCATRSHRALGSRLSIGTPSTGDTNIAGTLHLTDLSGAETRNSV